MNHLLQLFGQSYLGRSNGPLIPSPFLLLKDRFQGGKVYELTFDLSGQDLLLKNIENCPSGKHHRSPFLSIQL